MNLMSPLSWSTYFSCFNATKQLMKFLKFYCQSISAERAADHVAIFQGAIKQLLEHGVIDLDEFLNPGGVRDDRGCQMFQQSLHREFLPQFFVEDACRGYSYPKSLHQLELFLAMALEIDHTPSPQSADHKLINVEYGYIDLDWFNLLNLFSQQPPHHLWQDQQRNKKAHKYAPFDFSKALKTQRATRQPLMKVIADSPKDEVFRYESIKALIDHEWADHAQFFFTAQFLSFVAFFCLPVGIDVSLSGEALRAQKGQPQGLSRFHIAMNGVALVCQFAFFVNELIQLSIKHTPLSHYFSNVWNLNDIACFPTYLLLQILLGNWMAETHVLQNDERTALIVLYLLVVVQTFIKILFFSRVSPRVGFLLQSVSKSVSNLGLLAVLAFLLNSLFAVMYMLLQMEAGDEDKYRYLFGPIRWFLYAARNGVLYQ